jgi:hypothetical protein
MGCNRTGTFRALVSHHYGPTNLSEESPTAARFGATTASMRGTCVAKEPQQTICNSRRMDPHWSGRRLPRPVLVPLGYTSTRRRRSSAIWSPLLTRSVIYGGFERHDEVTHARLLVSWETRNTPRQGEGGLCQVTGSSRRRRLLGLRTLDIHSPSRESVFFSSARARGVVQFQHASLQPRKLGRRQVAAFAKVANCVEARRQREEVVVANSS